MRSNLDRFMAWQIKLNESLNFLRIAYKLTILLPLI